METPTPQIARGWLQEEFSRRRGRNPRYSLRAFSASLRVPSGRLSELLSGKRPITQSLASRIAERLALAPGERREFFDCVARERSGPATESAGFAQLESDSFQVISDWYHFAILSLLETRDWREDPAWIAERLGINPVEVSAALERLERLGLVARKGDGKLFATQRNVATTTDVASAALRRSHRQSLEQAIEKLEEVDVDDRDITSITMAIDPASLGLAKKMIRDFRRKLCATLETGKRSEVFNLNVQLVPVSRLRKKERKK